MSLSQVKIKVPSEGISRAVQEELFKQGYSWPTSGKTPSHLDEEYLFAYPSGAITHSSDSDTFRRNGGVEVIAVTESRLAVVEFKPVRDKVVVFGKTYYKDDVDAALAKLEVARV
jgi:hypothetical protein